MSRLDELIAELCPNGVEYKRLGDVCEVRSGWGFPNTEQGLTSGELPFFKVGDMNNPGNEQFMFSSNNYVTRETAQRLGCKPAPIGTVIFPKIGAAIGTNKKRITVSESCYDNNVMGLIANDRILPSFLFYVMGSIELIKFTDYSGALPSIRKSAIEKYRIPVPPLPVQQEVVRILDHFTELTAALTAELTARKKQYEYYRNRLLSCDDLKRRVKIGEVCEVFTGGEPPTDCIKGIVPDVDHPYAVWGNGKDVYGYSGSYRIDKDAVVISSIGANTGTVYYHKAFFTPIIRLKVIVPKEDNLDMRFLYHALSSTKIESKSSSVPNMNAAEIKALSIPWLDISEQRRIAGILDQFDALCEDLSDGVPAEIAVRQKQYEYYRDKLLSFKELER